MKRADRTLLGFDFGKKHIGVAVGQELTGAATPLETLHPVSDKPDWDAITRLIETWRPAGLVVGIPLHMDGSEQDMTLEARRFARQLAGRFQLPVYPVDERLSTIEAGHLLHDSDTDRHRARRKRGIDAIAAQIILQTWFNEASRGTQDTGDG